MAQAAKPDNNYNVCMMPTKDQIEAMPGTPLTKEDIEKMQAEGQLPQGLDPSVGAPTLHRIKQGDQEILVIMIDPPPCGCVRLPNGKKKRCKKHRLERRAKRRARKQKKSKETAEKGTKMVKDDESDRKKLVELRHAADSESDEDKAIDGAITPDKVCAVGPAGVAVLVEVEKVETAEVGPRAKMEKQTIKGILIKGAHETPQFIPIEKVQKDKDGKIKYRNYTMGQLVKGKHGEAIFYADGQCTCDGHGNPQNMKVEGVDETVQKKLGEQLCVPCEVEVNEKGMVTVKHIACAEDVPKDKYAAVGVINKNTDGYIVFTQTAGQRIGSSDNAPVVACAPNDKVEPGTVIGIVYEDKQGKTQVLPKDAKAPADQKTVGVVLLGEYREPVFVKDIKQSQAQKAQNMPIIIIIERDVKANQATIESADLVIQSKVQNKTQQEILTEKAEFKNAQPIKQEVWSTSLAPGGMQGAGGGARSVFVKQGMEPGGAAGGAGATGTTTRQTYTKTVITTTTSGASGGATNGAGATGGQAYSKTVTTTSGTNGAGSAGAGAAGSQAYSKTVTTTSGTNGAGAAGAGAAGSQAYSKTVTTTSGTSGAGAAGAGAAGGQAYSKTVTTTSGTSGAGAAGTGAAGGQTYTKTVTTTTTTTYTNGAAGAAGSQAGGVVMVPPAGGCQIHGQAQTQSMHTHTQTQTTHTHTHTGTGQHLCACLRGKGGAAGQGQTGKSGVASGIGGAGTSGTGASGAGGAGAGGAGAGGAGAGRAGGAGAGGAGAGAGSAFRGVVLGTTSVDTGAVGAGGYGSGGAGGAGAGGAGAGGAGAGAGSAFRGVVLGTTSVDTGAVGAGGYGSGGAGGAGAGGAGAGGAGAGAGSAFRGVGLGTTSVDTGAVGAGGYGSGGAGGAGAGGAGGGKSSGGGYTSDAVSVYAGVIKVGTPGSVPWEHPPPKNGDPGAHSVFVTRK